MQITDYIIDIKDSSLADRLKLRQVLLDNGQVLSFPNAVLWKQKTVKSKLVGFEYNGWRSVTEIKSNILLHDFITKFKVQDQIRNIAFYKRSGEHWIGNEFDSIQAFVDGYTDKHNYTKTKDVYLRKYVYRETSEPRTAAWNRQDIHNYLQIAYEDIFPEEQPIQPEPEFTYPLFMQDKKLGFVVKFKSIDSGNYLTTDNIYEDGYRAGYFSKLLIAHTNDIWEHCDFTKEPEIFDIDWWDARYEAGLPVWCNHEGRVNYTVTSLPSIHREKHPLAIFYISNPSCQDTVEANQPTTKEQTMPKLSLQLLLEMMSEMAQQTETKSAVNANYVGILTENNEYIGYVYFDEESDATEIMQKPENEGRQLHIFEYNKTIAQKPRKVITVERV